MKSILTLILIFLVLISKAQPISNYSDNRISPEVQSKLNNINLQNFDTFSAKGKSINLAMVGISEYSYDLKYDEGFITGTIAYTSQSKNKLIQVSLPFIYCCNHNPNHCAKTKEEIKENQDKNHCSGWHRADVY